MQRGLKTQVEGVKDDIKKNNVKLENEITSIRSEMTEILDIINKLQVPNKQWIY